MEEGSQTETSVGTDSPLGIAVVDIAHERLGLEFFVDLYGGEHGGLLEAGNLEPWNDPPDCQGGKTFGGITDTGFLVAPFNSGRETLFEGVTEGRGETGSRFKTGAPENS